MTSKERVLAALAHEEPDRVPVNYSANAGIDRRLKAHFGLSPEDAEGLRRALGVDFRGVHAPYKGPKLHKDIPERGIKVDNWGIRRRWVEHESGGYWDFCDFPLREADEKTIAAWPMPSPDDYDYSDVARQCREHEGYCVTTGGAGLPDIINATGMIRSMEQVLMDLALDDPAGLSYINRRTAVLYEITARTLEAAKGKIDVLWMGEDLGTQIGPMISMDLFRRHIRPRHQKFVDLAKSFGLRVIIHSCGSSSWAFNDFIEMGIDAVETLQPEAKDMAPAYIKKAFGAKLAFHGCISTAGPVATGTVDETIRYCKDTLEIMMPGGGYCFAPTHSLQDNSPTENVAAMYETARRFGSY
ncbi:MAG TPA: uroporphyrinogen decarboxylase family protein [Candidatus Brocadiia bacterium]|nr:uroporphyrinogen decarboxylase family protein [Candidatus Brocadiia bacterium]